VKNTTFSKHFTLNTQNKATFKVLYYCNNVKLTLWLTLSHMNCFPTKQSINHVRRINCARQIVVVLWCLLALLRHAVHVTSYPQCLESRSFFEQSQQWWELWCYLRPLQVMALWRHY